LNTQFDPELSRLAFEDRLIEYCEDPSLPLLDRVRLLGIAGGRLDVFFMTRVGRLKRLIANEETKRSNAGMDPLEQLIIVTSEAKRVMERAYSLLHEDLLPALAKHDILLRSWTDLTDQERASARKAHADKLELLIHPIIVETATGFPHVRNLRPTLIAAARRKYETDCFVVIELPAELPRLVRIGGRNHFVPLEQLIVAELPGLLPDVLLLDTHLFRVTRNADTDFESEHDVLAGIEQEVVRRPFQEVIRLEVDDAMPASMRQHLQDVFQSEEDTPASALNDRDTYAVEGLVDLTALEEFAELELPALKARPTEHRQVRIDERVLDPAKPRDTLLHFPFDDYETSIEHFLMQMAGRDDIASIQTAIYRTDKDSGVVEALRKSKSRGADVGAVVELKASFDERDNIELARSLEAEGIRVVLSPSSLKVHSKVALVSLRDGRQVALIGTGNMNAITARLYVDLWLVTGKPAWTGDLSALFDVMNGRMPAAQLQTQCLFIAPFNMRRKFLALIEREAENAQAGKRAGIRVMINGLTDQAIIGALYRASQAGVPIEMIVRGICELQPGKATISENIRVVSVAGRLLQHARIFHFHNDGADEYYVGSADWRPRNLDGRIEVVARVSEAEHAARLDGILTETFATEDAWDLGEDGVYVRRDQRTAGAEGERVERALRASA
jgi:polyphosphate kinase